MGFRSRRGQGTIEPTNLQLDVTLEIAGHISHFEDKETKDWRNHVTIQTTSNEFGN